MQIDPLLADSLSTLLGLSHPPVAVSFRDQPVADAQLVDPVPAGCCFWAQAEQRRLVTTAPDHAGCTVGRHVLGLMLPLEDPAQADDVAALVASGWVTPGDLGEVPTLDRTPAQVVYEPLAETTSADVVLLRVTPEILMRLQPAVAGLELVGKPQCQILARAAAGQPAVSPGCAVSRVRTGLPADELTVALPAAVLPDVVRRLRETSTADDAVAAYALAGLPPR